MLLFQFYLYERKINTIIVRFHETKFIFKICVGINPYPANVENMMSF